MPSTVKNLGGPSRTFIMGELRALDGWKEWRDANGISGNDNSRPVIDQAAEHFGYDVDARAKYFFEVEHPRRMAALAASANASASATASAINLHARPAAPASTAQFNTDTDKEIELMIAEGEAAKAKGEADAEGEAAEVAEAEPVPSFEGKDADTLLSEALAPLAPHMTGFLQAELPKALRPAFLAAVQGPRIVSVPLVTSAGGRMKASVPDAKVTEWLAPAKAFTAFAARGNATSPVLQAGRIPRCDYALAPKIDPDYRWNWSILAKLAACDVEGDIAWVYGHAGTGKTEGVRHYAAVLRRPFIRIAINRATDEVSLTGQYMLSKDGGMTWADGKLSDALRIPYAVILIDEVTLMRPGALALFQTALDTRELFLDNGERLEAAPGIFVVGADNTAGAGDASGRYVDTAAMNLAFLDRFALKIQFEYLPEAEEAKMLHNRTGIHLEAAKIMTHFVALTRKDADAGKLTAGLGPRRVIAWAKHTKHLGSKEAFINAVLNGTAPEDIEPLMMLVATSLESLHDRIDQLVQGLPAPASAPASPAPSATGAQFDTNTSN